MTLLHPSTSAQVEADLGWSTPDAQTGGLSYLLVLVLDSFGLKGMDFSVETRLKLGAIVLVLRLVQTPHAFTWALS